MTIEIHQPELEALIAQRMQSGVFRSVEDVLLQALRSAPIVETAPQVSSHPSSADFLAAMQSSPLNEIELEHPHPYLPVRDVDF
jgi:hypothetical protein